MKIFGPVVCSFAIDMLREQPQISKCSMIGPQLISDDKHWREAVLLEQAAHHFFGRFGISPGLNKKVQYRAFIVYRSP